MKLKGKTEAYLRSLSESGRVLHFSLFDPEKIDLDKLYKYAKMLFDAGTSAFLVGGTLNVNVEKLNLILDLLEDFEIPKIIFPSNINLISSKADAILFMSLLNSDDIYYIVGAQVVAAPIVKASGLEVLPTAYIIIGYGGTAAHVGRARVIPYDNLDLAIAYSLAAEYMGMRFIYLESGSGAPEPVRPEMVRAVRRAVKSFLLVGGGIKSKEAAIKLAESGANAIVTGNIIEKDPEKAVEIIKGLKTVKLSDAGI